METTQYDQVVQEVLNKTNSELILFFILALVAVVIGFIPLYRMNLKNRREHLAHESTRQDKYIEREKEIIRVITLNTEAITGLKTTLDLMSVSTNTSFVRIHERLDGQSERLLEQSANIARLQTSFEEVIRKQHNISDDLKRGFADLKQSAVSTSG